jgi:serine O-acetyltransferase
VALDSRGHWYAEFREDWARYAAHHGDKWLRALTFEQGLWALFQYRISSAIHRSTALGALKVPALTLAIVTQKAVEVFTNVRIPFQADLAPGQYIGHFGPTIFHSEVVMGTGCNISQGVTIGLSGRGAKRGVPTIGKRVYIGANAIVVGNITIGDDAVIGANSLVTRDVPTGSTVSGNPAKVINHYGNKGMGLHQHPVSWSTTASSIRSGRAKIATS